MKKQCMYIFIIIFCLCSCKQKNQSGVEQVSASYDYELIKVDNNKKAFELDSETRYNAFYLWWFKDKGKEYLSFLNYRTNQVLFYDFDTCDFLFKIEMEREGRDGINLISGYYVKDFNNIYVSSYEIPGLVKIDTTKNIKQKILYGKANEGYVIVPSYTPSAHPYIPPVFINNKLYITQRAAGHIYSAAKTPITVMIDTLNHTYEQMPFVYGDVMSEEQDEAGGSFSRAYNGKEFIYSFDTHEYVYVLPEDHKTRRNVYAKSKYIDKGEILFDSPYPGYNQRGMRWVLETPRYGDMIYDQYREVYYRFAYPEVELDPDGDYYQKGLYGRSKFSVIIFDKDFNIIGETLFPENIYNSYVFFVHPDGLYISSDYQINFDQSEDAMTFELFKLVEQE